MKIVLTGSSGSLAEGIISLTLSNTTHSLVLVDARPPQSGGRLNDPRIEYITADLRNYVTFLEILTSKRADALIHLAAYPAPGHAHPSEIHNSNVNLSYNALTAAVEAHITKVVIASSVNATGACYGTSDPEYDYFPMDENHPIRCEDPYSLSKYIAEVQGDSIARANPDMSISSLRFHHVVPTKKRLACSVPEAKRDLWGYIVASSAARASLLALDVGWKGHQVMFVVSDQHAAEGCNATDLAREHFPKAQIRGKLSPDQGFYDCSKAERLLGWKHVGGKQI